MITDEDVAKVKAQPFDEDLFCEAASYLFQAENGVNRYNEPKNATDKQIDLARLYIDKWDCEVEGWSYAGLEEGMWQDLQETKKRTAVAIQPTNTQLTVNEQLGAMANEAARRFTFADYQARRAEATLRAQKAALALFAEYLLVLRQRQIEKGETPHSLDVDNLTTDASAWADITWGLVKGFGIWMVNSGYAIATVNHRLTTVRTYAKLAFKAGTLSETDYMLIQAVEGYSRKEARRVDEKRDTTRIGDKKAKHTRLTLSQVRRLKEQPDTPQGRRDAVMMTLLLEHGLRVGELVSLEVANVDLEVNELTFFRSKVDKIQTHNLTDNSAAVLGAYLQQDNPQGQLLMGSKRVKGGDAALVGGMSTRAVNSRVGKLGAELGIDNLSPHDLRHYWTTNASKSNSNPFAIQEAGGWSSLAMPRRYTEENKVANEGIKLTL